MKKILITSATMIIICLAGITTLFTVRPETAFAASAIIDDLTASVPEMNVSEPDCVNVTLEQLLGDDRCRVENTLMLINSEHPLTEYTSDSITEYKDSGVYMNKDITDSYAELSAAVMTNCGKKLYIRSAYRSNSEQTEVSEAYGKTAAEPGASEHEAGLAADVYISGYAGMTFIRSETGRYVNTHCEEYGFIIRYPVYGEKITGISYEPWHIRYVGFPHSQIISDASLTLEEYINLLEPGKFYMSGDYIITRQSGDSFETPEEYLSAVISPDNTGYYILTFRIS